MKNELLFAAKLFVSKILPNEAVLPIVMILLELNFLSFSFSGSSSEGNSASNEG